MDSKKDASLLNNSRFYILSTSILLSIAMVAWLRLKISSDQLYYIRLQQVFGLIAVLYWYVALVISPLGYLVGKQRMKYLEFARRAIGVSAAYFAVLHAAVALWGQLGGLSEITLLPSVFKLSLLGGLMALIILGLMAITSFDKVINFMTFTRWKWLHRLVYIGGIVAVLHIWSIGTHIEYSGVRIVALFALIVLSGLETYRIVTLYARKHPAMQRKDYFYTVVLTLWAVWIVLIASMPVLVQSYHGNHSEHAGHGHGGMMHHE